MWWYLALANSTATVMWVALFSNHIVDAHIHIRTPASTNISIIKKESCSCRLVVTVDNQQTHETYSTNVQSACPYDYEMQDGQWLYEAIIGTHLHI